MRIWIAIAAWTLVPFGAIGLVWSLIDFSLWGIFINAVLMGIGAHDIWQLKKVAHEPGRWRWMAATQVLLGLIIAISMAWLGMTVTTTAMWQESVQSAREVMVNTLGANPYELDLAIKRSSAIMKWGLIIGSVLVFLSQVWVGIKLMRLSRSSTPPPLPAKP